MEVAPTAPAFSGLIFKLQANMDPKHRDRVAFVRVVSGAPAGAHACTLACLHAPRHPHPHPHLRACHCSRMLAGRGTAQCSSCRSVHAKHRSKTAIRQLQAGKQGREASPLSHHCGVLKGSAVCVSPAGKFEKGMKVRVARSGRVVTLARPQKMFANDRATVQEGFAGDVIGLTNPGAFAIGDTLVGMSSPTVAFPPIPTFSPELFAYLRCSSSQKKAFLKGMEGEDACWPCPGCWCGGWCCVVVCMGRGRAGRSPEAVLLLCSAASGVQERAWVVDQPCMHACLA